MKKYVCFSVCQHKLYITIQTYLNMQCCNEMNKSNTCKVNNDTLFALNTRKSSNAIAVIPIHFINTWSSMLTRSIDAFVYIYKKNRYTTIKLRMEIVNVSKPDNNPIKEKKKKVKGKLFLVYGKIGRSSCLNNRVYLTMTSIFFFA